MKNFLNCILLLTVVICNAQPVTLINDPLSLILKLNDAVYDANSDKVFAITRADDSNNPNSLVTINTQTNTIESSVYVGDNPTVMAISDNYQYIYIGFEDSDIIRRFDIASQTFDLTFSLGLGPAPFFDIYYVRNIAVMPGNPNAVAVSRHDEDNNSKGTAIYENGIKRPSEVMSPYSWLLKFKDSSTLIGYNGNSSNCPLNIHNVNSSGLSLTSTNNMMPSSLWMSGYDIDFCISNDKLFFNHGRVVKLLPSPSLNGALQDLEEGAIMNDEANNLICFAARIFSPYLSDEFGYFWLIINRYNPVDNVLYDSMYVKTIMPPYSVDKIFKCGNDAYGIISDLHQRFTIARNQTILATTISESGKDGVSVYPNPTSGVINIHSGDFKIVNAKIYTIDGKLVLENNEPTAIDLSAFSKGMYAIILTDENSNISIKKFIRN